MSSLIHRSLPQRLLAVLVALPLSLPAVSVAAAAPKASEAAPATDGKTIALMRFTGDPAGTELRENMKLSLEQADYTVRTPAIDVQSAAAKVKCKGEPTGDDCLASLGKWLNASPKTAADFIMFGNVDSGPSKQAEIVVYDIAGGKRVTTLKPNLGIGDLILPIALPQQLVRSITEYKTPPAPASAEEQKILDTLDEPEKTEEEIKAEQDALAEAEKQAEEEGLGAAAEIGEVEVDLKKDFKEFCRNEKRTKRKSRDDPKDLRPACKRGPFWGYWQPRAWVALGLTAGAALGTVAFYSLALVARSPYKSAVDDLDAFNARVGGDGAQNPTLVDPDGQSYDALATEVSATGAVMRRRAIVGDVLLGTTVLLGAVMGIIIYQDRRDAKEYIKQEKALKAVSNVRVGPILTRDTKGVGLHFRF